MISRLKLAAGLLLLVMMQWQPAYAEPVTEDDVKLALVYKISRFVSWPETDGIGDFMLCLADAKAHVKAVRRLKGRSIRERAIRVHLITDRADDDPATCDVVYLTNDDAARSSALINRFANQPVLMVSDIPQFAENGGMVGLSIVDGRISMTINVATYERAGLIISSQLLELARLIEIERRASK